MDKMKEGRRRKRSSPDSNSSDASFLEAADNADDRFYRNHPTYTRYTLHQIGPQGGPKVVYDKDFEAHTLRPLQDMEGNLKYSSNSTNTSLPTLGTTDNNVSTKFSNEHNKIHTTRESLDSLLRKIQKFELLFGNSDAATVHRQHVSLGEWIVLM